MVTTMTLVTMVATKTTVNMGTTMTSDHNDHCDHNDHSDHNDHTDHDDHGMQYLLAAVHSERCRGLQQLGGGGRLGVLQVGVRAPAICLFTRLEESSLVPAGFLTAQFLQKT